MKTIKLLSVILAVIGIGVGCAGSGKQGVGEKQLTLGVVQKEIHTGMSQADVAEGIGSPNIVTKDSSGREVWIYDRQASEARYSNSNLYGTILIVGFSRNRGSETHSQRTLTVVIRFDNKSRVESFSYHASRF